MSRQEHIARDTCMGSLEAATCRVPKIDVDLSPEKSAFAAFRRAGRRQSAPWLGRTRHSQQYSQSPVQRRVRPRQSALSRDRRRRYRPQHPGIGFCARTGRHHRAGAIDPGLIDEAGRRGAAGAVIVSAGLGHGPGSLADAAERAAQKYGMRLIGPNCLGIMMPGVSLNASFSAHMPAAGNLALISQSGAIAAGMVDWAAQRAVGFSGIVSIGDQLDVDIADLLDYFALDEKTQAILLYIEAIKDARKFMSAARAAARVKPVVVVKSGRMAQGAQGRSDPYRRIGRRGRRLRCRIPARRNFAGIRSSRAVRLRRDGRAGQIAARETAGDPDQWRRHRRARRRPAG